MRVRSLAGWVLVVATGVTPLACGETSRSGGQGTSDDAEPSGPTAASDSNSVGGGPGVGGTGDAETDGRASSGTDAGGASSTGGGASGGVGGGADGGTGGGTGGSESVAASGAAGESGGSDEPPDGAVCDCLRDEDCDTNHCSDGWCEPARCDDGTLNGSETDVDCGGPACPPCERVLYCAEHADCSEGVQCVCGNCEPYPDDTGVSCVDGIQNGVETGVDCGGIGCPPCFVERCCDDRECASNVCISTVCAEPSCFDGVVNGDESDVDCGGSCDPCVPGLRCNDYLDCTSETCLIHRRASDGCEEIRRCSAKIKRRPPME